MSNHRGRRGAQRQWNRRGTTPLQAQSSIVNHQWSIQRLPLLTTLSPRPPIRSGNRPPATALSTRIPQMDTDFPSEKVPDTVPFARQLLRNKELVSSRSLGLSVEIPIQDVDRAGRMTHNSSILTSLMPTQLTIRWCSRFQRTMVH
jgi:hypothetical protein